MDTPKLWTKNFLIIMLENFFVYFTYYMLIAVVAIYASEKFHATPSEAGLSAGIFIIGAIFGRLYAGSSIERTGHKKMLYIGFIFYLITTLLYFTVNSLLLLIVVRFFHGAAFGLASTATGTISAEIIPNKRRGEGTGYYALSMTVATAIGPLLSMILTQHVGFYANLVVCAIVLSFSFIAAFFLYIPKKSVENNIKPADNKFTLSSCFEEKAIPISIIVCLVCFGYSSVLSFLSSFVKSLDLVEAGSTFFLVYAVCILISRPFSGRLFDRKGENYVIYPTLFLFIIALTILGSANQGYTIMLAAVVMGFGYGNFFAAAQALAVKISPENRRGLATSTIYIFADMGSGFGPFILGLIIPLLGFRGLYYSMAALIAATMVLYYYLHHKRQRKGQKDYEQITI